MYLGRPFSGRFSEVRTPKRKVRFPPHSGHSVRKLASAQRMQGAENRPDRQRGSKFAIISSAAFTCPPLTLFVVSASIIWKPAKVARTRASR